MSAGARSRIFLLGSTIAAATGRKLQAAGRLPLLQSHTTPALILAQHLHMTKALNFSKPFDYETESEETLESLCERFEEILQDDPSMGESDVSLASGVLTVVIPGHGTYVVNKQAPNRQIWLSSPVSGPARYISCLSIPFLQNVPLLVAVQPFLVIKKN